MSQKPTMDGLCAAASWGFALASLSLISWRVYWMNVHEVGAHAFPPFALPMAVMTFALGLVLTSVLMGLGKARRRVVVTGVALVVILFATAPWEMLQSP